ncbi:MAG: hypothetical protein Q9197_006978, partial [Variospora fuerteventurae]
HTINSHSFMHTLFTPNKVRNSHAPSQSTPHFQRPPAESPFTDDRSHDHYGHSVLPHTHEMPEIPSLTHHSATISPLSPSLPPLVIQERPQLRPSRPGSKIADWFSGSSDPIPFALIPSPTKEKCDPIDRMSSSTAEQPGARAEQSSANTNPSKPPIISRFSLFGSRPNPPQPPVARSDLYDEWHDLDIKSALHPHAPSDPYSPSVFKSLQQNAEGLLLKLQSAYKQRSQALHDVLAEKEAQEEELKGADMRAKHLKVQLDGMTARLAEQDSAMMDLVDQLAQEKQLRREAEDAMVAKIKKARPAIITTTNVQEAHAEDVEYSEERPWKSRTSTASDLSIESDGSSAESLFSRHGGATSPAMSMSSVSTMNSPETQQRHQSPAYRLPPVQVTTFGSRLLGIRAETHKGEVSPTPAPSSSLSSSTTKSTRCCNNHNINNIKTNNKNHDDASSEAWALVGILQLENQGLKTRLGQLENTVDDCLGLVKKGLF